MSVTPIKKIVIIALLLSIPSLFMLGCGSDSDNSTSLVKGQISHLDSTKKLQLYKLLPKKSQLVDSTVADKDGNFSFNYDAIKNTGYYRIEVSENKYLTLILSPEEHVTVKADADDLINKYSVKGSKESQKLQDYNHFVMNNFVKRDSINKLYQSKMGDPKIDSIRSALRPVFQSYFEEMQNKASKIINEDPSSFVALAAVQQLDKGQFLDLYLKVDSAFSKAHPKSPYFQPFHSKVDGMKKLANGSPIPDIILPDTTGKQKKLSDLKGNIVLVDFWASWCGPCRRENPNVVKAYKKYHDKGFDIFSVSLDGRQDQKNPKEAWEKAIKKDGLVWPNHVSSLDGWQSPVVPVFQIQGIPFNILIDKNGNIIAKNLRGEELQNKLAEIFG